MHQLRRQIGLAALLAPGEVDIPPPLRPTRRAALFQQPEVPGGQLLDTGQDRMRIGHIAPGHIGFERLRVEFAKSPYKETAVLTLQERIQARLDRMMAQNPSRIDLYKRYQEIIADYNKDKDDAEIQRVFDDLMTLHDSLDQEEQRYIREGFKTEKELAVFDLLSKDKTSITKGDIDKIKKVAQELMDSVEQRRQEMGDLRDRASSQAQMKAAIIDRMLEGMPDEFSSEDIEARAEVIYQYVETQIQSAAVH